MNFGESAFSTEFNQKTSKGGLFVKRNHGIMPRHLHGKTLEDSRRLSTEVEHEPLLGRAGCPTCQAIQPLWVNFPLPIRLHLRRSLSQFDPRAHVATSGLYIPACTLRAEEGSDPKS
jgi:hypothetical protein